MNNETVRFKVGVVVQMKGARRPTAPADSSQAGQAEPEDTDTNECRACDLRGVYALVIYLIISIFFFGRSLLGHLSTLHIGVGPDPPMNLWFLAWWPHAIVNGLNPLFTYAIWAPFGLNLTWEPSIPLAGVLASPITRILGPVVAFNVVCLLSLPLNAWCAFILCRYLSRDYLSSLLGGYIFGFSAYMLGRMLFANLALLLVCPVPLAVYFAARRIGGEITARRFAFLLALLLVAQFLLGLEVFLTMSMAGAVAWLLGWSLADADMRQRLLFLLKPIAYGYAVALAVVSPYLYYFFIFGSGFGSSPVFPATLFSADLLNLVIPTQVNELGGISFLRAISVKFPGSIGDSGACLSLPLIIVAVLYARRHSHQPFGRLLIDFLVLAVVLSLGPKLSIGGRATSVALPWRLFEGIPIINDVMVGRFAMYACLILALMTSLWLAIVNDRPALKFTLAAAIIAFNVPNLSAAFWTTPVDAPPFFRDGIYRNYLSRGERVVILPYAYTPSCTLCWQAQTGMYFELAEGGSGVRLSDYLRWPIVPAFGGKIYVPDPESQLRAFLIAHGVGALIVTEQAFPTWQKLFSTLGIQPIKVGGVYLYPLATNPGVDIETILHKSRSPFDTQRLITLITAADKYLSEGGSLDSLNILNLVKLNLISQDLVLGPIRDFDSHLSPHPAVNPYLSYGLELQGLPGDRVGLGELVWYPGIAPLVERLHSVASEVYYPSPEKLTVRAHSAEVNTYGVLLVVFTRKQLSQAAALLRESPAREVPAPAHLSEQSERAN